MTVGATENHFLESTASVPVRRFIEDYAQEVWDEQSRPGAGGTVNCLATVGAWHRRLARTTIRVEQLGRQLRLGRAETGGYLVPGEPEPRDHHWLALGEELALFDPTYGQFKEYGPAVLDRYITADGETFPEWRAARLLPRGHEALVTGSVAPLKQALQQSARPATA